ncbi:GNAT family N-acetyltransferase [Streptomyces sp. SCSIO ZS0520]|uniref:GNAT family N-acetyltransferase n=1 Tax=Streptomyces sp. SCSIO ZS0520 TaxID=2892996 RepID=UPI0021DA4D4A|nr:GNAT family N-acetyltransferase [Streptomyces sp. SCSIO ZS0520]
MRIRDARPAEAPELSALLRRSKAHWGYEAAFLDAIAEELTLDAAELAKRRVVVAEEERTGELLGLASLEGTAPRGALGLLFVEPERVRTGVGRTLYAHVLDRARELGFASLTVDADPHAVDFYRRLGAQPVPGPGPLPRLTVAVPARAPWARAWTRARRTVQLGNVAEFQGQFSPLTAAAREASAHYSCLAALTSPSPAALVLPATVPPGWTALLARALGWSDPELYDGLGSGGGAGDPTTGSRTASGRTAPSPTVRGLTAEVLARPALTARLRTLDLPVLPWGRTPATAELTGEPLAPGALRHESKRAANALFHRLAPHCPGILVPRQRIAATRREAARLLAASLRTGPGAVLKSEQGVGGYGTHLLTSYRGLLPALRSVPRGPLLVEEYVRGGAGGPRDLTFDGVVDAEGAVHAVGTGVMAVRGTAYQGVTVGPGVVPAELDRIAVRFGLAVGRELAATGHRGWFDVDFVRAPGGRLAPTEINQRLTGPSAAFVTAARLDEVRGGRHCVRALDHLPLGARLPDAQLLPWLTQLTARCARVGAVLLPSVPTAAYAAAPYLGVLIAARDVDLLDAAEALLREAARDLGELFNSP